MPIKSNIACALAMIALTSMRTATAAEFHFDGGMIDAVVNGALAAHRSYYGTGDPRCPRVRTSDGYGHYVGWIHTCMLPPDIAHGELRSRRLIVGDENKRAASPW